MPRLIAKLKIPALLLLITIAFHWKLTLSGQYTCLESSDNVYQVMPWLEAQAAQWHSYRFPLWDPHQWAGQPLVGQVQPGTLNPLNWILFSMPLKDGSIQIPIVHWYWVLIQFLAVLFCYWFCRDLELSEAASILGGCAFGLGGFVGTIGWPQKMLSAVLLPLILMFFLRALRGENALQNAAASGALLGASFLSGHHDVPVFFTLATIGLWFYYVAVRRRKAIAPAAAFFVCFALIAAAQILPAFELGRLSLRWVSAPSPLLWDEKVPYSVHEQFSVSPASLVGLVMHGFGRHAGLFVGVVTVTLGLLGAVARWKDRTVRLLAVVAVGALLFSLGGSSLFHGILYAVVPDLGKARTPNMAEAIFDLGISVLAAYGLDSFRSTEASEGARRLAIRLLGFTSFFLYAALVVLIVVQPDKSETYKLVAQTALVALLAAGILSIWNRSRISNRAGHILMILLLLFELYPVTTYVYQPFEKATTLHKLYEHQDLGAFLQQQQDWPRVEVDQKEIPYNFGDWFGVDQLGGYQAGIVKSIAEVQHESRFRMLLATNYSIGRTSARPDQSAMFEGQRGMMIFRNPGAMPRARIVHAAIGAPDERAVISAVDNPATDLQRTVVLPGQAPQLETCEGGSAEIQRYQPSVIVVRTDAPCKSMAIIADTWFPGWEAFVDGNPAEIWKAYNVIRGVVVDRGQHEVRMVYRPASVFSGAALALLGVLIVIVLHRKPRWKGPPPVESSALGSGH